MCRDGNVEVLDSDSPTLQVSPGCTEFVTNVVVSGDPPHLPQKRAEPSEQTIPALRPPHPRKAVFNLGADGLRQQDVRSVVGHHALADRRFAGHGGQQRIGVQ